MSISQRTPASMIYLDIRNLRFSAVTNIFGSKGLFRRFGRSKAPPFDRKEREKAPTNLRRSHRSI